MPRNRYTNASAATVAAAERSILQKENQFHHQLKKIHTYSSQFAETIAINGTMEALLRNDDDPNDPENEENMRFLEEQRMKIKSITEGHVNTSRYIQALMNATNSIKNDLIQGSQSSTSGGDDGEEKKNGSSSKDYESILQSKLEIEKHDIEKNSIAIEHEEMYRKVRESLNEKLPSSNKNDDDDEIEVEISHNDNENSFKCPLTAMFFEEPMKNKLCGHVYEKGALQHHLKFKRHCPVMGCNNSAVTMSQCEPDEEMILKVRRYKRIQEKKRQRNQMSQDYDIDDEEEEYGGGNDENGMTVIE